MVGDRQVWPAADRIAAWMHETALRLFPDSLLCQEPHRLSGHLRSRSDAAEA
jgi:hypothetical protein